MILLENEILFAEGSPGDKLYIVKSGSLEILKREGEKTIILGEIGAGALIGEQALLEKQPYPYTLKALEKTELISVHQKELNETLKKQPGWFRTMLHFLSKRNQDVLEQKRKIQTLRALPVFFFLLSRVIQKTGNDTFDLNYLLSEIEKINGLDYQNSFQLVKALESLNILKIISAKTVRIRIHHPKMVVLLYQTLFSRATQNQYPETLLSAGEQIILSAFTEASKKYGIHKGDDCFISYDDFLNAHQKIIPGVRLTHNSISSLIHKNFIQTIPEINPEKPSETILSFKGNLDLILDLLELNRIYPLLDKELPQKL